MKSPLAVDLPASPNAPSPDLMGRILQTIQSTRWQRWRRDAVLLCIGLFLHITYTAISWSMVWMEIRESSFVELMRLSWSDPDIVWANLQTYVASMMEALPVEPLALICAALFLLFGGAVLWRAWRKLRSQANNLALIQSKQAI